jgi:hypothetical protein
VVRLCTSCRPHQRGNVMLVLLLAIGGLGLLGGITIVATRGGLAAAGHDRFKTVALYAAESGAAAGVDYLRRQSIAGVAWSELVSPSNETPLSPEDALGNGVRPGDDGNPFDASMGAWYEIEILNDPSDAGFVAGDDRNGRVIVRATGHGPDGSVARVEWDVRANGETAAASASPHCAGYGQRGLAEDNAGRNDCLTEIDHTVVETYTPGGP